MVSAVSRQGRSWGVARGDAGGHSQTLRCEHDHGRPECVMGHANQVLCPTKGQAGTSATRLCLVTGWPWWVSRRFNPAISPDEDW